MIFKIRYIANFINNHAIFSENLKNNDFSTRLIKNDNGFSLDIIPNKPIKLISITAEFEHVFKKNDKLFLNGYQSWTDSKELTVNSAMQGLKHAPRFIQKKYVLRPYGDYDFTTYTGKKGDLHGFSYAYIRNDNAYELWGSISERTGFTVIYFNTKENRIIFSKDCNNLVLNNSYNAFDIIHLCGQESAVFDNYFEAMGIKKPIAKPITGYTSWYNYYQNINEEIINKNIDSVVKSSFRFDVFQIDDGYQTHVGDWTSANKAKFPHGLAEITERIKNNNMVPGIWIAPFACEFNSVIAKEHPDWILHDKSGLPVKGGGNWGGFYVLDFYNYMVRDYIRECFNTLINKWGFGLLKLDFLYAVCLAPDEYHTRGQIMCEAMDFLRECAGNALLLGCGVPLAPAFGKVDYCRIGCDIGLDYDGSPYMRLLHRERVSTKNSIGNTIYRRQLSGRAFINDPDVFLLRDNNIKLSKRKREQLAAVNSLLGGVLFTSDDVSAYNSWQLKVLKRISEERAHSNIKVLNKGKRTLIITDNKAISIKL